MVRVLHEKAQEARRPSAGTAVLGDDAGVPPAKIGIVVVAYNAAATLAKVLDRIPRDFRERITEVLVCDDHSDDSTYLVGLGYKQLAKDLPITVIRHDKNLGYGGNQKEAYRLASEHGLDIVALLHGDGQYAPELLPELIAPLEAGKCDAVFGSRMILSGEARKGGMPLYKYVGNRILTKFENRMLRSNLSEFHSGYRAYRVDVLDQLRLARNSDGFDFDTQIIIQLHDAGSRILEIPIPTYYGNEICYVDGMKYAKEVSQEVLRYRMARMGFGSGPRCLAPDGSEDDPSQPYALKESESSSHGQILRWLSSCGPSRVLDLGCSSGLLSAKVRELGHTVVGTDIEEHPDVRDRVSEFVAGDLNAGIPDAVGSNFDVILAADIIEHLASPERLLRQAAKRLAPDGVVLACVPNFGHWYPRLRIASGHFGYDKRGILDEGHLRFFTQRTFERLVHAAGFTINRHTTTGLPIDVLTADSNSIWQTIGRVDHLARALRPQLFGYQLLYELRSNKEAADGGMVVTELPEGAGVLKAVRR